MRELRAGHVPVRSTKRTSRAIGCGREGRGAGRWTHVAAAVALLVIGYLAIYLLVFLPRGPVG